MRANAVGKKCAEVDLAYIAGLMDADGAIMAIIEPHHEQKFRFRVRIELKITQKHKRSIAFLPLLLDSGSVCAHKAAYDWITRDQEDIADILSMLRPYSRIKRRQVDTALQILAIPIRKRTDLMRVARLADTLSKFNVRSNNRRKNTAAMSKHNSPLTTD